MAISTTLTFPHTELTLIDKKPTNSTLQRLQRELYANARSIPSARSGGNNGHLALLMNNVDYQARAGQLFIIPIHPGAAPHHLANATGPQIAETVCLFNQNIAEHTLYHSVATAIKAQLLHAVDNTYLRYLEDADFGFTDVTPEAMLNHLKLEYGQLTPKALGINRAALSEPWNPEEPLENLWKKITEIQRVATAGVAPITDIAIITLTRAMFKKSANKRQPCPPAPKPTTSLRRPLSHQHGTRANKYRPAHTAATASTRPSPAVPKTAIHAALQTIANQKLCHVAASAAALFCLLSPDLFHYTAYHGNTFNPDTGKLAESLELSKSSNRAKWQASNLEEIGRLAQGFGTTTGTNTMFFIPPSTIPNNQKYHVSLRRLRVPT